MCRDGSLLGTERLLELVQAGVGVSEPTHVIHHLLAKLAVFGATFNDDVTVLLVRCEGAAIGGRGFWGGLWAQVKFLGQVVTLRGNIPWPEWSKRNVGGAVGLGRSVKEQV